jgi:hypothetical protein
MTASGASRSSFGMPGLATPESAATTWPRATHCDLPSPYRIMPHVIPYRIPGFQRHFTPHDFTLSPEPIDSAEWFAQFRSRVEDAIGRRYLPVCRMADGEYLLLFGQQPPSLRWQAGKRFLLSCKGLKAQFHARLMGFESATAPGVSSGRMSSAEWRVYGAKLSSAYRSILSEGILAMHLGVSVIPWQEHYFPALGRWLAEAEVAVTPNNYVPFYFVYALLRGANRSKLFAGRDLVVVHSAVGEKRRRIAEALTAEGARRVQWITISPSRSFADVLDLSCITGRPEICLLGAGVGKAALFNQLRLLAIPCIDAGFVFEVWANPEKRWDRPMMVADNTFDLDHVRYIDDATKSFIRASQGGHAAQAAEILTGIRRSRSVRECQSPT